MHSLKELFYTLILTALSFSSLAAKTNYAYVANSLELSVSVINTANNTVVTTISAGLNPVGVAVNQAGTVAYVTNYNSNSVSVISTSTNTVIATIPIPGRPIGVVI